MSIVIALSVSKIYVSNQIYYRSKEINKLEIEVSALKEENSILSMNVEKLRYKTEILDTIKDYDKDYSYSSKNSTTETDENRLESFDDNQEEEKQQQQQQQQFKSQPQQKKESKEEKKQEKEEDLDNDI